MKMYRYGIVVGKFAPLHKGHEFLINTAIAQCEKVVVVSYCLPELNGCDAEKRLHWLQTLFPQVISIVVAQATLDAWKATHQWSLPMPENTADDDLHRQFTLTLLNKYALPPMDAVFSSETYGQGFADYLAEAYTRESQSRHQVIAVNVDPVRATLPISGSQLRADIHGQKHWLSPVVYADFVKTACFLGGESTGKTTLAQLMAQRRQTQWVAEYGRERWLVNGGHLTWQDYIDIARIHIERERQLRAICNTWLFSDTSPMTTLFYCLHQYKHAPASLLAAASRHYDRVFLCLPDFAFVQDGTRRDDVFRHHQHTWYTDRLHQSGSNVIELVGSIDQRIATIEYSLDHPSTL